MKKINFVLLSVLALPIAMAQSTANTHIIIAKKQAVTNQLSYAGIIDPLETQVVTSTEEGTIDHLNFQYGQPVQAGQLLFEVNSKKFQDNFIAALKTYLTAKQQFHQVETKQQEQGELWKYGLISRDVYTSVQAEYYNDELALLQAEQALVSMLQAHKSIQIDYQDLELRNIEQLKKILYSRVQSDVKVYAPTSGIALIPSKNANKGLGDAAGSATAAGPVVQGSAVQQNQAVLAIGNLNGMTINIDVNEIYVNELTPGLKAIITSVAFPGVTLRGEITRVGSQATSNGSSDIPTFPVVVKVPTLTPVQRSVIRVGMSADVRLIITEAPKITIPINAVTQKNGQSYVDLQTATGITQQVVTTGETTVNSVVIVSGLKEGDAVVAPN